MNPRVRPSPFSIAVLLVATAFPLAASADDAASATEDRVTGAVPPESDERGRAIFLERCASCHGRGGEGVKGEYSRPLVGDKSVVQLARYIEKSMPDESPEECVGEDARLVARFIYDTFYSPIAQARNRPARIELSHLTQRQFRNAVGDLVAAFRAPSPALTTGGLRGEYFASRRPGRDRAVERTDPVVQFDFLAENPDAEKLGTQGFSARWEGSVLAPDTGVYEFVVRTDHAARLWVNDREEPLIDAWVKSGDGTEFRASRYLIDGRAYPLRLEFSSRNQGVRKDEKNPKPVPAFIELHWRRPGSPDELIPARHLSTERAPEFFVLDTAFPPDDRSVGYERGTSVSRAWVEATTTAAIDTASYVEANLRELAGARDDGAKLRSFSRRWVERAFRRPLRDDETSAYVDRQFDGAPDGASAVKRVVLLSLKSPRFLYPGLEGGDFAAASRLSFALWDSIPDERLLQAAASGSLRTPGDASEHARRMLGDRRARAKMRWFLHRWLDVADEREIEKSADRFPKFSAEIVADLRTSLDLYLDDVVWSRGADFRRFFLGNEWFVNDRLGAYYGVDLPKGAPFQRVPAERTERAGVLSHPYIMARFAYADFSSPIHRGVFLARNVLGRALRPPPEAFTPLPADLHPDLTTRERIELQTKPTACRGCHGLINPFGFALENFDAVGQFRAEEKGKPIDVSGSYELPSGEERSFRGARELAQFVAGSEQAHEAFVVQLFHNTAKQPIRAFGPGVADELLREFVENGFDIQKLLVRVAEIAAMPPRDGSPRPRLRRF